jgi:hypothetical protein
MILFNYQRSLNKIGGNLKSFQVHGLQKFQTGPSMPLHYWWLVFEKYLNTWGWAFDKVDASAPK